MAEVLKGNAAAAVKQRTAKANAKVKGNAGSDAGDAKHVAEQAEQAAQDLIILHPDGSFTLDGRTAIVREYGHIEGLMLQVGIKPFQEAMYHLFAKTAVPPTVLQIRDVFAEHALAVQWLIAQSITPRPKNPEKLQYFAEEVAKNAEWVGGLDDIQGDALMAVWWGVVRGFFIRRFRERLLAERQAENQSDPPGSTQI